ncbi:hypothetical protein EG329_007996 [Mollisiaceae sp. DMI_Dod_QoI]|nr:hypothetical protein EG329_007996 [Helotiales sp. DMI_Dod_QoI]
MLVRSIPGLEHKVSGGYWPACNLKWGPDDINFYFSRIDGVDWTSLYFLPLYSHVENIEGAEDTSFVVTSGLVMSPTETTKGHFRRIGVFAKFGRSRSQDEQDEISQMDKLGDSVYQASDEMYTQVYEDKNGATKRVITSAVIFIYK